jgi:hypothetical protein
MGACSTPCATNPSSRLNASATRDLAGIERTHFEPAVRQQLAIIGARQSRSQLDLIAEALNDLFVKYEQSAIARVYGEGSKSRPRTR